MKRIKQYTTEQMDEVQEFINGSFGNGKEGIIGHELRSEFVHTDVAAVTTEEGDRCFVTFGMSARKTKAPVPQLRRTELLMYATEDIELNSHKATVIMGELQSLSKYPFRNNTFFGPGHTIDASEVFTEIFGFEAFVLVPAQVTQVTGLGDVIFLLAIPIYKEEREVMMKGNSFDVIDLLEAAFGGEVFYVDSGRDRLYF